MGDDVPELALKDCPDPLFLAFLSRAAFLFTTSRFSLIASFTSLLEGLIVVKIVKNYKHFRMAWMIMPESH